MSLWGIQLRGELLKLFARKRTYIGFGAFLAVEVLLLVLLRLEPVQRSISRAIDRAGYAAEDYLSGLTLAFMVLLWAVFLLGSLYLALVSGDLVSKEAEDGTLRMMLCRPVSRNRIIAVKAAAAVFYTFALVGFIGISALLAGLSYGGVGGMFVFAPAEGLFALYDFGEGLSRYAASLPLLALSLLTISALGFFFSCTNMKPAAATIVTLSVLFVDLIVKNIPYFESIRGWFITARMNAWLGIFEYQIPWEAMLESYAWLAAINASLFLLGAAVFAGRDFKS